MKYLRIYEEYAEDRSKKRRREAFDKKSDAVKKNQYDAKSIMKKLKTQYPEENFTIIDYYDTIAKCVFLSDNSILLNSWRRGDRDNNKYDDGLEKKFADWLKSKKLSWNWHSPDSKTYWDGITITPNDFKGILWYYNQPEEEKIYTIREDRSSLEDAINAFKELGYDVYDPGVRENDSDYNDRDIVELDEGGMKIRFNMMRNRTGRDSLENQVIDDHYKYIQTLIRYYKPVKAVYDYCETIAEGPLWTICGGGMQLQQFYGDDNGYLCILYLGMLEDENDFRCGYLVTQQNKNKSKFKNLKISKIKKLKTSYANLPSDVKNRIDDYKMKKNVDKYNI